MPVGLWFWSKTEPGFGFTVTALQKKLVDTKPT